MRSPCAVAESKYKFKDILSEYDYKKRFGLGSQTPAGVRCTGDATLTNQIERQLKTLKLDIPEEEKKCTNFLKCFVCDNHVLVAMVDDIWLMMSFYDVIKSLKEQSSLSSEIGMYWDKNVSGYTWCESNITTQVAIMEAFNEINSQKDDIEKMKIWLLKNKQTNQWSNVISTVDAISALAFQGNNVLENESQIAIKLNNQEVKPQNSSLVGSNYVKISYDATDLMPEMGNISISKTGKGLSWGAAYWQYFEQMDKLNTQQKGPLNIDKKLFVEKITDKVK